MTKQVGGGPIVALTLRQPWAHAVALGFKRIENRRWRPAVDRLPMRLAIHAGKRIDVAGLEFCSAMGVPVDAMATSAIVAMVTVRRVLSESLDPWWRGPVGWLLEDVQPIRPIACSGQRGLWTPSRRLQRLLREATAGGL